MDFFIQLVANGLKFRTTILCWNTKININILNNYSLWSLRSSYIKYRVQIIIDDTAPQLKPRPRVLSYIWKLKWASQRKLLSAIIELESLPVSMDTKLNSDLGSCHSPLFKKLVKTLPLSGYRNNLIKSNILIGRKKGITF